MTPTTLAEALTDALVRRDAERGGAPHITPSMEPYRSTAVSAATFLLALPPDRRAAMAAELLDVETLAAALDALPPLPFGLLNEKAIVAMDELPTSRGWAAAILAALKGT